MVRARPGRAPDLAALSPNPAMPNLPPDLDLDPDTRLRAELVALLRGGQAHLDAAAVLEGIPPARVNERVAAHSLWDLLEHLRRTQADILEFCRPGYTDKAWPDDYWPASPARPSDWEASRFQFVEDLDALLELAETGDLFAEFDWAPGYTLLRELLLVADHNSHHLGQILTLRRHLGLWE